MKNKTFIFFDALWRWLPLSPAWINASVKITPIPPLCGGLWLTLEPEVVVHLLISCGKPIVDVGVEVDRD